MKRKNIVSGLYIIIVIGLFCLASSCRKDILNQSPPTQLSSANYWTTAQDLQNYVNYFYSALYPKYAGSFSLCQFGVDGNSDEMVPQSYSRRLNGEYSIANGGYADWRDIYNVNYFLANYKRVYSNGVTAAQAAPFVGEAYFFRAMLYFNGLQNFGGLPWINQPLNVNDNAQLYQPRLARNVLADSIVSDLNNAIALLPVKSSAQTKRVYKEYAEAFKSSVCLYEGTWEKYHATDAFGVPGQDGSQFLQMAADAANQVISSGTFSLDNVGVYDGYWKLFNQTDYSSSKEVIFWGAENVTNGGASPLQNILQGGSNGGGGNSGIAKSLVDDYLCKDGQPISASPLYQGDDSLTHVVGNRDPRLRQTIFIPGDTVTTNTPVTTFTYPSLLANMINTTGYQLYKGLNPDPSLDTHTNTGPVCGIIYMRYAEVLLNYAEAKAELGTITQGDVDASINLLRDRVGMPHLTIGAIVTDPNWEFPALSPIINEVRRERHVELACEGFRFNDICRWAAAGTLIQGKLPLGAKESQWATATLPGGKLVPGSNVYVNSNGYISYYAQTAQLAGGFHFNVNRDYLLPIDQTDITINPKLKQNPGW